MTAICNRTTARRLLCSAMTLTMGMWANTVEAAQQAAPAAPPAVRPPASSEEIVITGTRRTDRTVTNSASPIDVISSTELVQQPTANLLDTVKNIVPSFFVGQNTISDASSFVRAPSLRGLPGDEVLVQINGKRLNRSALVQVYTGGDTGLSFGSQGADISAIPAIAIKNLQVLRDGATAQYGSDAIAGVMNFGLRNDRKGIELQARYGQFYDHGDTKLDSGKSRQVAGNVGVGIGATGFIDVAGEYYDDTGTSRGATRPIAVIFAQNNPSLANQLPNYPLPVQIWGLSPQHGWKAALNSGVDITSNSQLYLTLLGAYNKANESFNYRSPISGTAVDVSGVSPRPKRRIFRSVLSHVLPGRQCHLPSRRFRAGQQYFPIHVALSRRFHAALRRRDQGTFWDGRLEGPLAGRPHLGPVRHARQEHARPVDVSVTERFLRTSVTDDLRVRHA
jgi:iron complex outermembrane receptor protein